MAPGATFVYRKYFLVFSAIFSYSPPQGTERYWAPLLGHNAALLGLVLYGLASGACPQARRREVCLRLW